MKNTDPFAPWNDPMYRNDPFAPHNDPMRKDDFSEPWNDVFGNASSLSRRDKEYYGIRDREDPYSNDERHFY
jgi:hypothetical protein